ncbi:MAG TPA: phospholipase [Polyangiaceae bacterium]|nr:phospholipase [Polyangiaceae bacterium]
MTKETVRIAPAPAPGRLLARPGPTAAKAKAPKGRRPLGVGAERDGILYVPEGYDPRLPAPLALMLHGAGGRAAHAIDPFSELADEHGVLLLAPDARASTWDIIVGDGFGPDLAFIDDALGRVFAGYAVDPSRVAAGGFSDGASYALSLGLTNGDLFGHLLAFSPGFAAPEAPRGAPLVYVSHGRRDEVLPIEACSRALVPRLRRAGYQVQYREFDGPHTVPRDLAREAFAWFARGMTPPSARGARESTRRP